MRRLATLLIALCLWAPVSADANPVCRWVGLCLYFSPGFELTVVDAHTGKPLPGVYAWAEWVQYGAHGVGGPLVVQDAFGDAAGRLTFPPWGPTRGSSAGLLRGTDPAIILFKSGYLTLLLENGVQLDASHQASIRSSSHHSQTLKLQPFRGSPDQWVEEVQKMIYPAVHGYVSNPHRDKFGQLYVRRASIALDELSKLPRDSSRAPSLLRAIERSMRFYRGEE
jgi:hypothetical protein